MQWVTTDSHHRLGVAANWLDGDFAADAPNRKWAGDITNIWTSEGWLYLAVIMDLLSRRVVGWAVSDRMAEGRRSQQGSGDQGIGHGGAPAPGRRPSPLAALNCVSGRGSQYYSYDDQKKLQVICPHRVDRLVC